MLSAAPIRDFIGTEFSGLSIADFDDNAIVARVLAALDETELVVIKRIELTPQQQVGIARRIGKPEPFMLEKYRHPAVPEIMISSNEIQDSKPVGVARVGNFWHQDSTFIDNPPQYTMLYGLRVPSTSGHTYFASAVDVLRRLPPEWRTRLSGRSAMHTVAKRLRIRDEHVGLSLAEFKDWIEAHHPKVEHPLLDEDPVSGKAFIYGAPEYLDHVIGFSEAENAEFLGVLDRTIRDPDFVYRHVWETDDLLFWKTRTALHLAGEVEDGAARTVHRISIRRP